MAFFLFYISQETGRHSILPKNLVCPSLCHPGRLSQSWLQPTTISLSCRRRHVQGGPLPVYAVTPTPKITYDNLPLPLPVRLKESGGRYLSKMLGVDLCIVVAV